MSWHYVAGFNIYMCISNIYLFPISPFEVLGVATTDRPCNYNDISYKALVSTRINFDLRRFKIIRRQKHAMTSTSSLWRRQCVMTSKVHDVKKTRHDVKKFVMMSKTRHAASKFFITSKTRHDAKKFVITSKTRHAVTWKVCYDDKNCVMTLNTSGLSKKSNILALILYFCDESFPSYQRLCVFHNIGDLDLWPIPVIYLQNAGIIPCYLHVNLCNNQPIFSEVIVWCRAADTQNHRHTYSDRQTPALQLPRFAKLTKEVMFLIW